MGKRESLRGKGIDDLLFGLAENEEELKEKKAPKKSKVKKLRSSDIKYEPSDVVERLTVPLPLDQVQALNSLERAIMNSRSRQAKKQRITKNSIIRACLQVFLRLDLDVKEIPDETELAKRIDQVIRT